MANWNTLTRSLVGTARPGAKHRERHRRSIHHGSQPLALANYVTDRGGLPGAAVTTRGNLHSVFSSLHTQRPLTFRNFYPLVPTLGPGRLVSLSGTLRAGSGIYHRATQPPGDPGFTLSFTAANGGPIDPATVPRLNVIRLQ